MSCECAGRVSREDNNGAGLRESLQWRVPLPHLVDIHIAVSEVHADAEALLGQLAALGEQLLSSKNALRPLTTRFASLTARLLSFTICIPPESPAHIFGEVTCGARIG